VSVRVELPIPATDAIGDAWSLTLLADGQYTVDLSTAATDPNGLRPAFAPTGTQPAFDATKSPGHPPGIDLLYSGSALVARSSNRSWTPSPRGPQAGPWRPSRRSIANFANLTIDHVVRGCDPFSPTKRAGNGACVMFTIARLV
jgi:hypothetical protein